MSKQKAIIDKSTRVIKRLTIEENHAITPQEEIVELDQPIDIGGGYWKLDNQNNKVAATNKEIDDAEVDQEKVTEKKKFKKDRYINSIKDFSENATDKNFFPKLKEFFESLKEIQ